MAWGQPRELQEFSKFWEESFGAAFIPWGMVKEYHLSALSDSCIIAEDTLPPGMSLHKREFECLINDFFVLFFIIDYFEHIFR